MTYAEIILVLACMAGSCLIVNGIEKFIKLFK